VLASGIDSLLNPENSYLPLYDAEAGCYRFYSYDVRAALVEAVNNKVVAVYAKVVFTKTSAYGLLADTANSHVKFKLLLNWTGALGSVNYYFKDATLAQYAGILEGNLSAKETLMLTLSGIDGLGAGATVTVTPIITSELGVAMEGATQTYQAD